MADKVQKILSEIATRKLCTMDEHMAFYNDKAKEDYRFLSEIEEIIKGMQEEPVSEDLISVAKQYVDSHVFGNEEDKFTRSVLVDMFCSGANWKEQQMMAKAIDGKVIANGMGNPILHLWDKGRHLIGKKVEVIVIKDE